MHFVVFIQRILERIDETVRLPLEDIGEDVGAGCFEFLYIEEQCHLKRASLASPWHANACKRLSAIPIRTRTLTSSTIARVHAHAF